MYGGTAIEGSDVFNVNGQTRSKCEYGQRLSQISSSPSLVYSSKRFIDDQVHGLTGNGIGACFHWCNDYSLSDMIW